MFPYLLIGFLSLLRYWNFLDFYDNLLNEISCFFVSSECLSVREVSCGYGCNACMYIYIWKRDWETETPLVQRAVSRQPHLHFTAPEFRRRWRPELHCATALLSCDSDLLRSPWSCLRREEEEEAVRDVDGVTLKQDLRGGRPCPDAKQLPHS